MFSKLCHNGRVLHSNRRSHRWRTRNFRRRILHVHGFYLGRIVTVHHRTLHLQRIGCLLYTSHQQYVKHEREDIAHPRYTLESQLEHIGQSDKHQSRTGIGRQPRNGIDCRKNDETGQHGHECVYQRHASGCLYQIGITRKIGSIRTKTSHADTHGKESLPDVYKRQAQLLE